MKHAGPCQGTMRLIHDGCMKWVRCCDRCGGTVERKKRRPRGAGNKCTWAVPCDDHGTKRCPFRNWGIQCVLAEHEGEAHEMPQINYP